MVNQYLQNFRKSKNLSLEGIAGEIGVSKSLYEKIEYGLRNPSFGFVTKLKGLYPDADIEQLIQISTTPIDRPEEPVDTT